MNTLLNHYESAIKRVGKICTINNTTNTIKCIFKEIDDGSKGIDTKYILTSDTLEQGDIIHYQGNSYIIITMNERINDVYNKYTIRECPSIIKFDFNNDTIITNFDFIVDSKYFDVSTGTFLTVVDNKIYVTIQDNSDSTQIAISDRFIKFNNAWKVIGINKTVEGLMSLTCQSDYFTDYDDKINEIAYSTAPIPPVTHTYNLTVSPTTVSIVTSGTQQITPIAIDNGVTIENPTLIYASDNTSIATVSSTGLITGIIEGNCTISVTYENITKTITTTITAAPPVHSYVLSVIPTSITIDAGATSQITGSVKDNDTDVVSPVFTYTSDNTSIATVNTTGLVTGVVAGTCNITMNYIGEDSVTYSQTISTTINASAPPIVAISTPSSITTIGYTTLIYKVTNNGVDITGNCEFMNDSSNTSVAVVYSEGDRGNNVKINRKTSGTCNIKAFVLDYDLKTIATIIIPVV